MKRFTSYLKEYDAAKDESARNIAHQVWSNLETAYKTGHYQSFENGIVFNLRKVQPSLNVDISIAFVNRDEAPMGVQGHLNRHGNQLVIFVAMESLMNERIFERPSYKETFVHEFIHLLDSERIGLEKWDGLLKHRKSLSAQTSKERTIAYVNDSLELNAHFQAAFTKYDDYYRSNRRMVALDLPKIKTQDDYDNFVWALNLINDYKEAEDKIMDELGRSNYVNLLTPENLRKLKNRIYQWWQSHKKEQDGWIEAARKKAGLK